MSDTDKPERYTNAWYRDQFEKIGKEFRGVNHSVNRCNAEFVNCFESVKELRTRADSQQVEMDSMAAEIGRLKEELAVSLEKAREAFRELKKG